MDNIVNIASESISVFPTVNRGDGNRLNRSQRLFTEQNVRDIANMVNSKDSYVVDYDSTSKILEFCLDGYHVYVDTDGLSTLSDGDVYAKANYTDSNLDGDSTSSQYVGITFQNSKPTWETDKYLLLGAKSGSNFTVAEESKIMYDGARVDSTSLALIDGGTI